MQAVVTPLISQVQGADELKSAHAAIAWRWQWLQLKISEARNMLAQYDEQYQRKRRNKKLLVPTAGYNHDEHCLRTVGMTKPKRRRKLCLFKNPTTGASAHI